MPRRLAELPRLYPRAAIWVVASEIYLHAIAEDVKALAAKLLNRDCLSLFSAGTKSLPGLTDYLLPLDARLRGIHCQPALTLVSPHNWMIECRDSRSLSRLVAT